MDYVHDTPVKQLMRKRPVFLWRAAAPVGAPVDRHDDNISRTLRRCNALRDRTEGAFGKIGDEGNARSALVRPPGRGNSAVRSPDPVDQHPAAIANIVLLGNSIYEGFSQGITRFFRSAHPA